MTVEESFAVICHECLAQFQANLPGLLHDGDPEYLHQARVALRRLRAGLRLFRRICPLSDTQLQQSLRGWSEVMGRARDWDVLCRETLPTIAPHYSDQQVWAHFAEAAETQRKNARQAMRDALIESNPGRVLLQFQRWLASQGWRTSTLRADQSAQQRRADLKQLRTHQTEGQSQSLPDFAEPALRTGQRKISRMVHDFAALSPAARHRLRILIKRQRYAAEFFKALKLGSKGKTYLQALVIAQDSLGHTHDADVASTLLLALTSVHDQRVAEFVKGWLARSAVPTLEPKVERALLSASHRAQE